MHFVSINTFLWAALRRGIACRREEIVVRVVFLPSGWRIAGALLPACLISKRCREVWGGGGNSFWSRLVPADLSGEVEKRHFLSKLHFRQHLATSHFYRRPRGLGREKWPHQCSGGSRVNGPGRKRGRECSPSTLEEMSLLAGATKWDSNLLWLMGNMSLYHLMQREN